MLRQLQLRAPIKGLQLKRFLTYDPKQLQLFALADPVKKESPKKLPSKPERRHFVSQLMVKCLPWGICNFRLELPIHERSHNNIRQYSVCLNPLEPLQLEQGKQSRSNNNLNMGGYSDMGVETTANSVALVPLEHSPVDQTMKNVGNSKPPPQPKPQPEQPEQPARKIPYYNPLRRRSNVDPARVQYIKDRFKELNVETDSSNNKPQGKKYISRTALHSGRLDKID